MYLQKHFKDTTQCDLESLDRALITEPANVRAVIDLLPSTIPACYHPDIVRGFDYYTGMVFEIFSKIALLPLDLLQQAVGMTTLLNNTEESLCLR